MADSDQSINNLRYNQVTQGMEGFGGGSPMWTPLTLIADGGISQLTGDVTAGPGAGSQAATIASGAVTAAKLASDAVTTVKILDSNVTTAKLAANSVTPAKISAGAADNFSFPGTSLTMGTDTSASFDLNIKATSSTGSTIRFWKAGVERWDLQTSAGNTKISILDVPNGFTVAEFDNFDDANSLGTRLNKLVVVNGLGSAADASSIMDVQSTTKGALLPRMTNAQRDAISSPAEGLTIYSLDDHALEFYNGTVWKVVATV